METITITPCPNIFIVQFSAEFGSDVLRLYCMLSFARQTMVHCVFITGTAWRDCVGIVLCEASPPRKESPVDCSSSALVERSLSAAKQSKPFNKRSIMKSCLTFKNNQSQILPNVVNA